MVRSNVTADITRGKPSPFLIVVEKNSTDFGTVQLEPKLKFFSKEINDTEKN